MLPISLQDTKILVFSLIAGLSANALLSGLTMVEVELSIFPLLSCLLAFFCMLQEYKARAIEGDIPLLTGASFLVGALSYSVCIRVIKPDIGSNFFPLIVCMGLIFWMCYKLGLFKS
jgi:hypothetical protein